MMTRWYLWFFDYQDIMHGVTTSADFQTLLTVIFLLPILWRTWEYLYIIETLKISPRLARVCKDPDVFFKNGYNIVTLLSYTAIRLKQEFINAGWMIRYKTKKF